MLDLEYSILNFIQASPQDVVQPPWLIMLRTWAEIIWRGATVVAIFVGGFFTWYKFIRGREFSKRVEPKLSSGTVTRRDGVIYLQAEASAKNIGSSKVSINHAATSITVALRRHGAAEWEELDGVVRVFQRQDSLEPNEEVGEPIMIDFEEENYLAAKLSFNFYAIGPRAWFAISIVNLAEEDSPP